MDRSSVKIFLLFIMLNIINVQCIYFKFTNITCECKDKSLCLVDYCYIGQVNPKTNFMSLSYMLYKPIYKDVGFHLKVMSDPNGWKKSLYVIDIDMCRFMKTRYNAIAKMIFGYIDEHSNMNHTCPYTSEKFLAIDNVTNTEIAKKLRGLPLVKGSYALFTTWSWKNVTSAQTNIYLDVLSS